MEFLRPLEINVVSAHGLKDVNFLSKMDVYVYVSIGDEPKTRKRTPVDKDGGKSPKWNHRMNFTVDESFVNQQPNLCLWFRIKSQRPLGDRDIGHVAVPLKELFDSNPADGERTVEYQVRTPDGKAKGTLKFAYKIGPKFGTPAVAAAGSSAVAAPKVKDSEPVTAYPSYGAGADNAYPAPPVTGYGPPPVGYAAPYAHPPPAASGYAHLPPAAAGYGYPPPHQAYPGGYPPAPGYGYPPPQQQGYGYPPVMQPPKKKKNNKMGLGLGAGLLGGLLVGDMIGDMGEMGAYDAGFDDGFGDAGFDF